MQSNDNTDGSLSVNEDDSLSDESTTSKTITIVADKKNPNQVLNPTIQPAIDAANPGDTIVLKGNFVHCHFTIDKPLNIVAASGATLGPCPHHQSEGAGSFGVFYVVEGGSGSVIEGFTFLNNDQSEIPYSFLIRGASNVTIKDCTMNFADPTKDKYIGIKIENSTDITISNFLINNTLNGIMINDSSDINIIDNVISDNENYGIMVFGENSENINIINNTIKGNGINGINLASANYINVINNIIQDNGLNSSDIGSGIYVNTNITKLIVKGNLFLSNGLHGIMYDYRTRNIGNDAVSANLTIVDNNYFTGHSSMILHHRTYVKDPNGSYNYDAENDTFVFVGNGEYTESKDFSYMQHSFVAYDAICGHTYYAPNVPWDLSAPGNNGKYNLSLAIGEITQVKKGVYQVSVVDKNGVVASDLSSLYVTFYVNDFSTTVPKETEVYKVVKMEKGTATVDLTDFKDKFMETGNIITAAFPGFSPNGEAG